MKYKGNQNWIVRLFLFFYLIIFIITSSIRNHFTPWDPTRRWFELIYAVLFLPLLIYVLYDWVQMRRYYQNEGAQTPGKVRRRQIFWYWVAFIACAGAIIMKLANFLWYQPISAPF